MVEVIRLQTIPSIFKTQIKTIYENSLYSKITNNKRKKIAGDDFLTAALPYITTHKKKPKNETK